ncbi:MAG: hypothetical protein L0Y58_09075 [Verrucomicrobia subdivision 3 bacterium]|nr:hypothetical protein [Limisphaerales bacterium]
MAAEVAEPCGLLLASVFFADFLCVVTTSQKSVLFANFFTESGIWFFRPIKECANVTKEIQIATKILNFFWLFENGVLPVLQTVFPPLSRRSAPVGQFVLF